MANADLPEPVVLGLCVLGFAVVTVTIGMIRIYTPHGLSTA